MATPPLRPQGLGLSMSSGEWEWLHQRWLPPCRPGLPGQAKALQHFLFHSQPWPPSGAAAGWDQECSPWKAGSGCSGPGLLLLSLLGKIRKHLCSLHRKYQERRKVCAQLLPGLTHRSRPQTWGGRAARPAAPLSSPGCTLASWRL